LEDFFEIPATDAREMGGYDLWRSRGLLRPNLLRLAYGLLGFARSETDDTSAREENDRDLPPKNFESPGLLMGSELSRALIWCNGPLKADCASKSPAEVVSSEEQELC
jgi:hypothetical protein